MSEAGQQVEYDFFCLQKYHYYKSTIAMIQILICTINHHRTKNVTKRTIVQKKKKKIAVN